MGAGELWKDSQGSVGRATNFLFLVFDDGNFGTVS